MLVSIKETVYTNLGMSSVDGSDVVDSDWSEDSSGTNTNPPTNGISRLILENLSIARTAASFRQMLTSFPLSAEVLLPHSRRRLIADREIHVRSPSDEAG